MVMIWRLNTEWKFEKFDCQGLQVVMMKLIVVLGDDPQDEDWMEPKLRFCYKILVRDSLQYTSEVGRNPLCNFFVRLSSSLVWVWLSSHALRHIMTSVYLRTDVTSVPCCLRSISCHKIFVNVLSTANGTVWHVLSSYLFSYMG